MALLRGAQKAALQQKASIAWGLLGSQWEMYLTQAGDRWRSAFIPLIEGLITEQGTRLNTRYGMQFDVRNLFAEAWFNDYELKFAQEIMATTKEDMSVILQDGMNQGWSIPTMQKHIGTLFEQYMSGGLTGDDFDWFSERMPNYRRETIARTETIRASNAGNTALYQDWGVPMHEWIATNDLRTRDAHIAAHGQRVNVGTAFIVGGEALMYPSDPAGSAANTINCRCTTVPYNPLWELLDEEGVEQAQVLDRVRGVGAAEPAALGVSGWGAPIDFYKLSSTPPSGWHDATAEEEAFYVDALGRRTPINVQNMWRGDAQQPVLVIAEDFGMAKYQGNWIFLPPKYIDSAVGKHEFIHHLASQEYIAGPLREGQYQPGVWFDHAAQAGRMRENEDLTMMLSSYSPDADQWTDNLVGIETGLTRDMLVEKVKVAEAFLRSVGAL